MLLYVDSNEPVAPDRPVDLVWGHPSALSGLRLTPEGTLGVSPGTAVPFGGPRPALRLLGTMDSLILSFDKEEDRDRALEQLRTSGRLTRQADGSFAAPGANGP